MKQPLSLALLTVLFVTSIANAADETPRRVDTSKAVPSDAVVIFIFL